MEFPYERIYRQFVIIDLLDMTLIAKKKKCLIERTYCRNAIRKRVNTWYGFMKIYSLYPSICWVIGSLQKIERSFCFISCKVEMKNSWTVVSPLLMKTRRGRCWNESKNWRKDTSQGESTGEINETICVLRGGSLKCWKKNFMVVGFAAHKGRWMRDVWREETIESENV